MSNESLVDSASRASSVGPVTSVAGSIADARAEADKYRDDDPVYAEMMENYAALGELLEANQHITPAIAAITPAAEVQDYDDECRSLMTRLIELERPLEFEWQQRWARWCVLNMNMDMHMMGVAGDLV